MSTASASPSASSPSLLSVLGQIPAALNQGFAQYGGTQGVISAMLQDAPGSQGAAAFGRSLMDAQNQAIARARARQQLQMGQLQLQRQLAMLPFMSAAMQQYLGTDSSGASTPAPQNGANGQSTAPGGTQPSAAPPNGSPALPPALAQRLAAQQRLRASGAAPVGAAAPAAAPGAAAGAMSATPPLMLAPQYRARLLAGASPAGAAAAPGAGAPVDAAAPGAPAAGAGLPAAGAVPPALRRLKAAGALAMLGFPNASTLEDVAKTQLQYNPQLATQMAAAKSKIAQDQALLAQARGAGNPALIQAMQTKLATDSGQLITSGMSGTLRMQQPNGSWTIYQPGSGLVTNTATGTRWLPGALAAEQQREQAQSLGAAAGKLVDVVNPITHQTYKVPESALLPPGPAGAAGASAAAAGAPNTASAQAGNLAELSPGQKGFLESRGEESGKYLDQLQDGADSAIGTNYSLDQMLAASKSVQLGPAAAGREWVEKSAAALGQQFGLDPPRELGNYEQLDKYANQIAFAATRQMGAREAAQIVRLQMESNPNKELVPQAFTGLVASIKAMNNYVIAKNSALQAQSGTDSDTALQAASVWTQKIDPRVWDLSLSPQLASKFAPALGVGKIATALPAMSHDDAIGVIRNLPAQLRAPVLARLPTAVKQEILTGMQQDLAGGQ